MLYTSIKSVEAQPNGTMVEISPSEITVGSADQTVPPTGYPFSFNVAVDNVTDLYAWQIRIYYYGYILNWTDAFYPPGHVFQDKQLIDIVPLQEKTTEDFENKTTVSLTNPINTLWLVPGDPPQRLYNLSQWIDNDNNGNLNALDIVWLELPEMPVRFYSVKDVKLEASTITLTVENWYVEFGATLIGDQPTFNGTGTLCQLNFTGVNIGVSVINFSRARAPQIETNLLDSNLNDIAFEMVDGAVTVLGVVEGEEPSEITLNVDKTSVKVDSNITISGDITPDKPGVNVTILYRPTDGSWTVLQTVQTDSQSHYTYTWTTTSVGTFEIKASWPGDPTHQSDESETKTVTVTPEKPAQPIDIWTYLPYIGIAAVIVVAVLLVYFLKVRKR